MQRLVRNKKPETDQPTCHESVWRGRDALHKDVNRVSTQAQNHASTVSVLVVVPRVRQPGIQKFRLNYTHGNASTHTNLQPTLADVANAFAALSMAEPLGKTPHWHKRCQLVQRHNPGRFATAALRATQFRLLFSNVG